MKAGFIPALAVGIACVAVACSSTAAPVATDSSPATSTTTTASVPPPPTPAAGPTSGVVSSGVVPVDGSGEECHAFTEGLDRFVFNRLQPIIERAADLLQAPPDGADRAKTAEGLAGAAGQLEGLVEELDLMGVPPRELVDLLLSIREGTRLYAAGFEKGARGWRSGDAHLVEEAKSEVSEASAVLTAHFGWRLCN